MRLLCTRKMPNEVAKHNKNANEAPKQENEGKFCGTRTMPLW